MKFPLLLLCAVIAAAAAGPGCGRPAAPVATPAAALRAIPEFRPPGQFKPSRKDALPYFEKTTVEAYRKVGARDPRWDAACEVALRLWAYQLCDDGSVACGPELSVLRAAIGQALAAGCNDPLLMYAAIRSDLVCQVPLAREFPATFYTRMIAGLPSHPYPPMRQLAMLMRGSEAIRNIGAPQLTPELQRRGMEWLTQAAGKLAEVDLAEADREDFYVMVNDLLSDFHTATGDRKEGYDRIAAALEKNPTTPEGLALGARGGFYVQWAWDARGRGAASKVTDEGWRLFTERLLIARQALEAAWAKGIADVYACQQMVVIAGVEQSREELETWFERGRKLAPGYYSLYGTKLNFIDPKWGGSEEQMRAFGLACFKAGLWEERIPLILVGAHDMIARETSPGMSEHFQRPGVWEEIQPVFEVYLSRFKDGFGVKSEYAYHAALAGRWPLANQLMDELGTNVLALGFGGNGPFYVWRDTIREHRKAR